MVDHFGSLEDKTFILLSKLLKLFPHLDFDLSYIDKYFFQKNFINGLKTSLVHGLRSTIDVFHPFVIAKIKFHQFSSKDECFVLNGTKGSNGRPSALFLTAQFLQKP